MQHPGVEINVLPAQPQHLATTQPKEQSDDEHRAELVIASAFQESLGLIDSERLSLRTARHAHLDKLGHVARQHLLANGMLNSSSKRRVDCPHQPFTGTLGPQIVQHCSNLLSRKTSQPSAPKARHDV
jgi:hypothetical protein